MRWLMLMAMLAAGCAARPVPGKSALELRVMAEPKAGMKQTFTHVPVYDAAPSASTSNGASARVDYTNVEDIIVWIEPPRESTVRIKQQNLRLLSSQPVEGVIPTSVGIHVWFENGSGKPMSLYSVSDGNEFDLGELATGERKSVVLKSAGVVEILTDPKRPPVVVMYAAPSEWVRRTRSGEKVLFNDIPPGQYQAVAWHARLPGSSVNVSLMPDQTTRATIDVGVKNIRQD